MNKRSHQIIATKALEMLPQDAHDFWRQYHDLLELTSNYPDIYAAPDQLSQEVLAQDSDYLDCIMVPKHGQDEKALVHSVIYPIDVRREFGPVLSYYVINILENLQNGNIKKAVKLAGCLSHVIGDTAQPAHILDDALIMDLVPPPKDQFFAFHPTVEKITGSFNSNYKARLLGTDVSEIIWRFQEKLQVMVKKCMGSAVPLLQAIYKENETEAATAAGLPLRLATELFTDFLLTAFRLHDKSIPQNETAFLNKLSLMDLEPTEQLCDDLFNKQVVKNIHPIYPKMNTVPLILGGEKRRGIAMLAYSMSPIYPENRKASATYLLPSGLYESFQSTIGLSELCENQTGAIYTVKLDEKTAYESPVINPNTAPLKISVPLAQAQTITLEARDCRSGQTPTRFFYPVWAEPRLEGHTQL